VREPIRLPACYFYYDYYWNIISVEAHDYSSKLRRTAETHKQTLQSKTWPRFIRFLWLFRSAKPFSNSLKLLIRTFDAMKIL